MERSPLGRPRTVDPRAGQALGAELQALRATSGLSRAALAERLGMSVGTLATIEQGRIADPGFFRVARIAQALGVGLDELVRRVAVTED